MDSANSFSRVALFRIYISIAEYRIGRIFASEASFLVPSMERIFAIIIIIYIQ